MKFTPAKCEHVGLFRSARTRLTPMLNMAQPTYWYRMNNKAGFSRFRFVFPVML